MHHDSIIVCLSLLLDFASNRSQSADSKGNTKFSILPPRFDAISFFIEHKLYAYRMIKIFEHLSETAKPDTVRFSA